MTWRMPEYRADLWLSFGGVAGEFCLSTLLMALFYVHLPDKFRWGVCRYLFLFLGASTFLNIFLFWRRVQAGTESIPWGSMVQGEEDAGGDMNILVVVYLVFVLRIDRLTGRWVVSLWPE
jgi:hypothetical protein